MHRRTIFPPLLTACLMAVGLLALSPAPVVTTSGFAAQKARDHSRSYVLESKRRGYRRRHRTQRIYLPVGPSYIYYDYPYYYARGHYPTHIGGYVYYYPKPRSRCSAAYRKCVSKHGQRGACRCR